jgi:lipoprotein NlpD
MLVRLLICAVLFTCLFGCASSPERHQTYRVRSGDTLYAIAQRYNLDYRELARWNGIGRDYRIYAGQTLTLTPRGRPSSPAASKASSSRATPTKAPAARPAVPPGPPVNWRWPASSPTFARTTRPNGGLGLTIEGSARDAINAAGDGRVVYTGTGLLGYGQLVIIKHNDTYLSAYGYTSALLVSEGDAVRAGQRIATMGPGPHGRPMLYFEIRVNGRPVDPLGFLPKR